MQYMDMGRARECKLGSSYRTGNGINYSTIKIIDTVFYTQFIEFIIACYSLAAYSDLTQKAK